MASRFSSITKVGGRGGHDAGTLLGLIEDDRAPVNAARETQMAQLGASWPFAILAQLIAVGAVGMAARENGRWFGSSGLIWGAAAVSAALGLGAPLWIAALRDWPAHRRARILLPAAALTAGSLLALLWHTTTLAPGPARLGAFVAVAGAVLISATLLQPVRVASIGFGGGLVIGIAAQSGTGPTLVAALAFLACLVIAARRLARFDIVRALARDEAASQGQFAARMVAEFEAQGSGWFWESDRSGCLTYLSEKVRNELKAAGIGEPIGRSLTDVFRMDGGASASERTLAFHLSSRTSFTDYSVCAASEMRNDRWWSISGRPASDEVGRFQGFIGSGTDLTEKRRSEAEITRLALFDGLTGLANRQRLRLSLDKMLAQSLGPVRPATLFLLDLDHFKAVNDTLGHQAGDALLKQVAQRLVRCVGEQGLCGRLGGDEFQVLLPELDSHDALAQLANAIIAALSQPYFVDGKSLSIGCSIGIAIAPLDGADSETLIRSADLALYAAKGDGRGIHRFYAEAMLLGAQGRKQLEDDLREAIAEGAFHLAYQPVVSTRDTRIVGYEALIRWEHPTRGPISPAEFVPVAEECGLIAVIGEWVLRTACRDAAAWPGDVRVAVNVSPIQFANPQLPALVASALAQSQLHPSRLELEITEGVFLDQTHSSDRMFAALKALGVRLALDDFGTGYSSLGYLRTAPFDKIKIDQSFVRGAAVPGNRNAAIIRAIVTLADTLGMETTAEGVEIQDEIDLVRELGCSHIQGYVYGKPARVEEVHRQLGAPDHVATASGFRTSRSPRASVLRTARLAIGTVEGNVHIRNISPGGAMIDGIEFDGEPGELDVLIELVEEQMFPAKLRWARDGKAGLEFSEAFNIERWNTPAPRVRKAG